VKYRLTLPDGTTREGSLRYRLSRWLETRALLRADHVTTICEGLREEAVRRGVDPQRITVVPNAVDADAFAAPRVLDPEVRRRLGLENACVLGFIGSFFAWEGLPLLVEALPRIVAARPDVRLLLVGGGPDEANVRAAVERLQVGRYVVFAGQVPHSQVAQLYLKTYPRLLAVGMRLSKVELDPRGAWELTLGNGARVRLGRQDVATRLERFIAIASPVVATRGADVSYVDLRYSNGFSIGWNAPTRVAHDAQDAKPDA
jgi:glycosyltransferase involved in cell wall biosynthesis